MAAPTGVSIEPPLNKSAKGRFNLKSLQSDRQMAAPISVLIWLQCAIYFENFTVWPLDGSTDQCIYLTAMCNLFGKLSCNSIVMEFYLAGCRAFESDYKRWIN